MKHLNLYGKIALLRAVCPECHRTSFIVDGVLECCCIRVDAKPPEFVKREVGIPPKQTTFQHYGMGRATLRHKKPL